MFSKVENAFVTIFLFLLLFQHVDLNAVDNEINGNTPQLDLLLPVNSRELLQVIEDGKSTLTLLNFWATWCDPCVEEFPDLVALSKSYPSDQLRIIFVSTDFEKQLPSVREFLSKQNLDQVSYYKNEGDQTFINAMNPEWSGALPATFVYDIVGNKLDFWIGSKTLEQLETIIKAHLKATKTAE